MPPFWVFAPRGAGDTRRAAARNWVGLRAPHPRSLFYEKSDQKRATRSLWSNPLYCPFSWRRAQSPAVAVAGQFTPSWLLHGAPFMPPRKRAQGFDVALYRRGAGRLVAAEVGFAASRTPGWHAPTAKKTTSYHWFRCPAAVKATITSLPCARGGGCPKGRRKGCTQHPPPSTIPQPLRGSSLCTREPLGSCPQRHHPPPRLLPPAGEEAGT